MMTIERWRGALPLMWISIALTAALVIATRAVDLISTPTAASGFLGAALLVVVGVLVGRRSALGFLGYGTIIGCAVLTALMFAWRIIAAPAWVPEWVVDWFARSAFATDDILGVVAFEGLTALHAIAWLRLRKASEAFRAITEVSRKSGLGWRQECGLLLGVVAFFALAILARTLPPRVLEEQDRYGIVEAGGAVRHEAVFGFIGPRDPGSGHARVERGGKWGLIDAEGRAAIPPRFENEHPLLREGRGVVVGWVDGKAGIFDLKGNTIVAPAYQGIDIADREFVWVKSGGKWGAIDASGKVRIAPDYARHGPALKEVVLVAGIDNRWRLLTRDGSPVSDADFAAVRVGNEDGGTGLIAATTDGKTWGYVDHSGNVAVEARFDDAYAFGAAGVARVRAGGKWGYVDRSGRTVVAPSWDDARAALAGGLLPVRSAGLWGLIDRAGKVVVEPRFSAILEAGEGMVAVQSANGKWGLLEADGAVAVEPRFSHAPAFGESGLARAGLGPDQHGVVDRKGRWVVEPRYPGAEVRPLGGSEAVIELTHARRRISVRDAAGNELLAPRAGVDAVFAKSGSTLLLKSIVRRFCLFERAVCLP